MKAELSHDILAAKIYAKASAEQLALRKAERFLEERFEFYQENQVLLKKKDLDYLSPFLSIIKPPEPQQVFIDKSQKAASGLFVKQLVGIAIATSFVILGAFSTYQYFRAKENGRLAQETEGVLLSKIDSLEEGKPILQAETALAKLKKDTADLQLIEAETQQSRARTLARKASEQALRAAQLKEVAQQNLGRAKQATEQVKRDSIRNGGFYKASQAQQALRDGNFRLAFHLAEKAWTLFPDSLTQAPLQKLARSPFQMTSTHNSPAKMVLPAPSGETFVSAYEDNSLHWAKSNGESLVWMKSPAEIIQMELSKSEAYLLTLTADDSIRIWTHSGNLYKSHARYTGNFVLVSDTSLLMITQSDEISHISFAGETIQKFTHRGVGKLYSGSQSANFTSFGDNYVRTWNLQGRELNSFNITTAHEDDYGDIITSFDRLGMQVSDISPQGTQILVYKENLAELWDVLRGKRIRSFRLEKGKKVLALHFPQTYVDTSYLKFDLDRDGILPEHDREPRSPLGAAVDVWGVARDSDRDGTIDLFDKSPQDRIFPAPHSRIHAFTYPEFHTFTYPHFAYVKKRNARYLKSRGQFYVGSDTPRKSVPLLLETFDNDGVPDLYAEDYDSQSGFYTYRLLQRPKYKRYVDLYGIPLDDDRDLVANFEDLEYNTPVGAPVDEEGVAKNSDEDKLIDFFDKEIHSSTDSVDNAGVGRDTDRDGVLDEKDEEELTPLQANVNEFGVSTDWKPLGRPVGVSRGHTQRYSETDADGDGILDEKDAEVYTPVGAWVDEKGKAVDTDGDGRPDLIDFEIHTPKSSRIDPFGRTIGIRGEWPTSGPAPPPPGISSPDYEDEDDDGVPNIFDKEKGTPIGSHVDQEGVSMDLDQDGVIDLWDLEKTTARGAPVDDRGIARDTDQDGVIDLFDLEPQTPPGIWVDRNGVSIDVDADGVVYNRDKDPYTPFGAPVDSFGVALDTDKDGVIDFVDLEPLTPPGEKVDKHGVRINLDQDGVGFEKDADSDGDGRFDSDIIVIVFEDALGLWRNTSQELVELFPHTWEEIKQTDISPDGRKILTYTRHGILRTWRSMQKVPEQLVLKKAINHLSFSPKGDKHFIAFRDGTVRIYFPSQAPDNPEDIILYYRQQLAPLSKEEAEKLGI